MNVDLDIEGPVHPEDDLLGTICPAYDATELPVDLPRSETVAAGAIGGTFSASSTGEATYTMPLAVPPGRAGMQPELAVSYDSSGGEGVLGMGFSVTGLSAVTRCPRTIAQDGEIRAVHYDQDDALCLDGKRLVEVGRAGDLVEYRTFPDTFTKVIASYEGWDWEKGPMYLRAYTKSGRIIEYGNEPSGRVMAKLGVVRAWWVTRVSDRYGNTMDTRYKSEEHPTEKYTVEHAPLRIDYTGHPSFPATRAVEFVYGEPQWGGRVLYSRGMELRSSWRLDEIRMLGPGDALVRNYRFLFDDAPATGRRLLQQVEECASDGVCKPPTRFGWHHGTKGFSWLATPLEVPTSDRRSSMLMDATGDGLDDIVMSDDELAMYEDVEVPLTTWFLAPNRLSEGVSTAFNVDRLVAEVTHLDPDTPFQPEVGTPIDYNQDGLTDIFMHDLQGRWPNWHVLLAEREGNFTRLDTEVARMYPLLSPWTPGSIKTPTHSAHLADVDGDGVSDLIQCGDDGISTAWWVHLWRPSGPEGPGFEPAPSPIPALNAYPCNADLHTVDADSDGKIELLVHTAVWIDDVTVTFGTTYDAVTYQSPGAWSITPTGLPVRLPGGRMLFLDVNGDGLSDAVQTGLPDRQLRTYVNTGDGFAAAVNSLPELWLEADRFANLAVPIDWNDDGRQDLLMPMAEPGGVPAWMILESTGRVGDGTFTLVDSHLPVEPLMLDSEVTLAHAQAPRVTDLNGDGVQDVLMSVGRFFRIFPNLLKDEDLLASVTDGMSSLDPEDPGFLPNVTITYSHLSSPHASDGLSPLPDEQKIYNPMENAAKEECAYPLRCALGPRAVVSGYTLNNGANAERRFEVAYRNGRYHRLGRGFLGFGKRIVRDLDTGSGTVEFYDNVTFDKDLNVFPYAHQVMREVRYSPLETHDQAPSGIVELSHTSSLIQTVKTNGGGTYFTLPVFRRDIRGQGEYSPAGGQSLEAYAIDRAGFPPILMSDATIAYGHYDEFGNILAESSSTTGADFSLLVKRKYTNDTAAWLIGKLDAVNECSSASGIDQCRRMSRTYNTRGQVVRESVGTEGDPQTELHLTYTRDVYGNLRITRAVDAFGARRNSCISYDEERIFPYARSNAEGHVTRMKFDPGLGVRTALVDPNHLVTRWAIDGFGRVAKEIRPGEEDEVITTFTRTKDGGASGTEWNVKVRMQETGGRDHTVELDSLGRPVRWWTHRPDVGAGADERVMQEIVFDALGERVARRSLPAGEDTPRDALRYDDTTYDGMGRIKTHRTPWGTTTRYTYLSTTVEVNGPRGVTTTIKNDALGRPVSITDAMLGETLYSYGPFGGLWTVTDPGGAVTTTERDAYGRVRKLTDPDRGETITHYSGFGLPTYAKDALGRERWFEYDRLGRMTARIDKEEGSDSTYRTTWTWDLGATGKGKIAEVESPEHHKTTYSYDPLGRLETKRLTLEGETFTTTFGYTPSNQLNLISYPAGDGGEPFSVLYELDPHGHVLEARNAETGDPYWALKETDRAGRIRTEEFGNGVVTERSYHATKNRLESLRTTKGAQELQNLAYTYDDRLNLETRKDLRQTKTEYFFYDKLDRLRCSQFRDLPRCLFVDTYAPNGNIDSKVGIGTYEYDPDQPHAVVQAGDRFYGYDAVGNQISRPGATVSYTPFDKPETFTLDGGVTIELDYDGDQNRIRKTTPDEVTLYVGELYERVTRLAPGAGEPSVEHRYSVLVNGRPVALVTRAAGAPGTTLYLHRDNLGSIDVLTDATGGVHERRSYQAWGKRRRPTWESAAPGWFGSSPVRQGFTGHEGDGELGLINMRGRMYDPVIGRFLTPDPLVANPLSGQSLNPYSYVLNNPLAYVDPNGFQEASPEDRDASRPPAVRHIPWERLGWVPEEIAVGKRPEQKAQSDSDTNTTGAEVGVVAPPVDVNIYGTSSGYVPEPAASTPDQSTVGSVVGEGLLGVGEGLGELSVDLGRSLVLSALTFGGYGAYEFGTAMWDGYKEDGVVGALNAVNPLYHALRAGTDTVLAAVEGDYRAAGAAGTKAVVLTLGAAVGLGEGLTAVSGRALATRAAAGEGWLVSRGVFRNRHGQLTNGRYILDEPGMAPHTAGSLADGRSQFLYGVNEKQLVLDAAAYADEASLWTAGNGRKARVVFDDFIGVHYKTGKRTNVLNIYRTDTGFVHGAPGSPL
ncbi:RHS repeat-associated core domain-containing protein [Sorangium sp. So ce542]|uniref:RHS repeat-associated core domain-containing protein n=1 Tax=Sorangium sp. So ce542 TaxID=3133316 RepID=UPI003F5FF7AF